MPEGRQEHLPWARLTGLSRVTRTGLSLRTGVLRHGPLESVSPDLGEPREDCLRGPQPQLGTGNPRRETLVTRREGTDQARRGDARQGGAEPRLGRRERGKGARLGARQPADRAGKGARGTSVSASGDGTEPTLPSQEASAVLGLRVLVRGRRAERHGVPPGCRTLQRPAVHGAGEGAEGGAGAAAPRGPESPGRGVRSLWPASAFCRLEHFPAQERETTRCS